MEHDRAQDQSEGETLYSQPAEQRAQAEEKLHNIEEYIEVVSESLRNIEQRILLHVEDGYDFSEDPEEIGKELVSRLEESTRRLEEYQIMRQAWIDNIAKLQKIQNQCSRILNRFDPKKFLPN
jgi:hypothetical protein